MMTKIYRKKQLADILSKYVDYLNEGTALPVGEFLKQYELSGKVLKKMREELELARMVKNTCG